MDDDPISQTNPLLNSGDVPDIFIGKYDCECSTTQTDCCDDLEASLMEDPNQQCCYTLDLSNQYGFTINEVEIIMNTEDIVFNLGMAGSGFQFDIISDDLISITHESGVIPNGDTEEVFSFCLSAIQGTSPPTIQDITIRWIGIDSPSGIPSLLCEEQEITECDDIITGNCVQLNEPMVACSDESDKVYTFDFNVTNLSQVTADALVINSQTPGITFTECFVPSMFSQTNIIHNFSSPLDILEASDDICLKVVSSELLQEETVVCFTLSLEGGSGDEVCCTEAVEYCITLQPCCLACESVAIVSEEWTDANGACCYQIDVSNECVDNFFTGIQVNSENDDVIFGSIVNGLIGDWTFMAVDSQTINWYPLEDYIPTGTFENLIQFCLDGSGDVSTVSFDWLVETANTDLDSIFCTEEILYDCDIDDVQCLLIEWDSICSIDSIGGYELILSVTNTSNSPPFDAQQLNISSTPGVFVFGGVTQFNP